MIGVEILTEVYICKQWSRFSMFLGTICPIGWYSVRPFKMCYYFMPIALTFDEAVDRCKAMSSNVASLATIDTTYELKLVKKLLPPER